MILWIQHFPWPCWTVLQVLSHPHGATWHLPIQIPSPFPAPLALTCSPLSLHPVQLSLKNVECYQIKITAKNRRRHLAGKWKHERYSSAEHRQALQEIELSFNHCNDTLSSHAGRAGAGEWSSQQTENSSEKWPLVMGRRRDYLGNAGKGFEVLGCEQLSLSFLWHAQTLSVLSTP